MKKRYDYHSVKLPEGDEPFETRDQVWSAFMRVTSALSALLDRAGITYLSDPPKPGSPLAEGEGHELLCRVKKLEETLDGVSQDVVARVASLDTGEKVEYTPAVDALRGDYYGDYRRWHHTATKADHIGLALIQLEAAGYDEDFTKELLAKIAEQDKSSWDYDRRHNKNAEDGRAVFECPRCEAQGDLLEPGGRKTARYGRATCERCDGRGFLLQEKAPADGEYELSKEGKWAQNAGMPWTRADEERVLRDDYGYDEDEILGRLEEVGL